MLGVNKRETTTSHTIHTRLATKGGSSPDFVYVFQFAMPSNSVIREVIVYSSGPDPAVTGRIAFIGIERKEYVDIVPYLANEIDIKIERGRVMQAEVTGFAAKELYVYYETSR